MMLWAGSGGLPKQELLPKYVPRHSHDNHSGIIMSHTYFLISSHLVHVEIVTAES